MRPMDWFLNIVYGVLLILVAPIIAYRLVFHAKYRTGWREKLLGRLPRCGRTGSVSLVAPVADAPGSSLSTQHSPSLWLHAVSVGEVLQLRQIVERLRAARPETEFVISTTTVTGHAVAREKFPDDIVCYFPLDFSWAVRRAIRRVKPDAIGLVELELWPNFILAAKQAGVPLVLVNGRISERSFRGYRRIRFLMRRRLGCFQTLAVQNEAYGRRLVELGAPPDRIVVTGSIKFDGVETDRSNPQSLELRRAFGIADDEMVFIAGSTQPPEEEYALDTWQALRDEYPNLRLILVPRHKERFEQVARLVEARGLPVVRRSMCRAAKAPVQRVAGVSEGSTFNAHHSKFNGARATDSLPSSCLPPQSSPPQTVCLLDTLGELAACWGLADIAFVGGSLTSRGGQNMIEPAAYGAAVLFGPNTWNFRDVVDVLLSSRAARVVCDADDLTRTVRELLLDRDAARRQGRTAQQLVLAQQGATDETVRLLIDALPPRAGETQSPMPHAA